jgi:ribosomal protein L30E
VDDEERGREERVLTLVRFAFRTGRVVVGETGARVAVRRGKRGVLLVATDLGEERAKRIRSWAASAALAVYGAAPGSRLAEAAGRDRCEVLFVHDRSIARSLSNELGGASGFC